MVDGVQARVGLGLLGWLLLTIAKVHGSVDRPSSREGFQIVKHVLRIQVACPSRDGLLKAALDETEIGIGEVLTVTYLQRRGTSVIAGDFIEATGRLYVQGVASPR